MADIPAEAVQAADTHCRAYWWRWGLLELTCTYEADHKGSHHDVHGERWAS